MVEKIRLTKEGEESLKKELRNLIDVVRPEVIDQLTAARAQGDLSENADYDAARSRQAEVEGRIKEIEYILANAEVIEETKKGKGVNLGSKVTLTYPNGKEKVYVIVSSIEADPEKGKISNVCPLGAALIGKKVNDKVIFKVNEAPHNVVVTKIE